MQFMIWDLEGDPIQAVVTALRERLDGWDFYNAEKVEPALPGYPKYKGSLFQKKSHAEIVRRYKFWFEVNVEEKTVSITVDRV